MGRPERDASTVADPQEASFPSQNTSPTLHARLSGYDGPRPLVGAAVQDQSSVDTAEQPELEPSEDGVHVDYASNIDGAMPVRG